MVEKLEVFLCLLKKLYNERFVSYTDLEKFKISQTPEFLRDFKNLKKLKRKSFLRFDFETYQKLKEIEKYLFDREKLNRQFIKNEQKKIYEIEGNKLDVEQIAAVVACEDAELILASAGSGKSASLMAKVNYIVDNLKIPAEEVLVVAFTRKVVKELNERMSGSGVEICTFHSFGNKIIKEYDKNMKLKLIPDNGLEILVEKILNKWWKTGKLNEKKIKDFGDIESLKKLTISTLQLQKNEQINLEEFYARILKMPDKKDLEKAKKFFGYYRTIFEIYEKTLEKRRLYDFSDMLSKATNLIAKMPKGELKYKYILVDEIQDLSLSKSLLLKAILKNCQDVKLFAVGDDWQSIYRFAGSNLGVLKDFEKIFGMYTYRGVISKTYRFGQPTAWVSEYFVRKNPAQSKKKVKTFKKSKTPIEIVLTNDSKNAPADYEAIDKSLNKIFEEIGVELFNKRVQIISRYNRDLYRLVKKESGEFRNAKIIAEKEDGVVLSWWIEKAKASLQVAFCSMHKSKGITRDIVFVINMNTGEKGMPSVRADEPILATMLAKPDKFPLAEERRLFYVAITRATEKTIVVAERKKASPFVKEIAKNLDGEE